MWPKDCSSVHWIYTKNTTHISLFAELVHLHSLWRPLQTRINYKHSNQSQINHIPIKSQQKLRTVCLKYAPKRDWILFVILKLEQECTSSLILMFMQRSVGNHPHKTYTYKIKAIHSTFYLCFFYSVHFQRAAPKMAHIRTPVPHSLWWIIMH